jgi:predicted dehydrogenase
MESVRMSKAKNRCLVAGFCWRYDRPRVEFYRRILDGAIGDIRAVHATYLTGPVKPMPAPGTRPAGMGDLEWQTRNWYNFVWLSGDGYVEQAIHSVDKVAWVMRDVPPLWAVGNGGRMIPNHEGNIYDHMNVTYEYAGGVKGFLGQRQITGCFSETHDYIWGSKNQGIIDGRGPAILGDAPWRYSGEGGNMYDLEHVALFQAIRAGQMLNDGDRMATSTLMGIMGRMAAYTGQKITWEQALNAKDNLVPEKLSWDMKLPIAPLAMPGRTRIG